MPLGTKKRGQCAAAIAVTIVQAIRNAPTRVSNPRKIRTPPISSENAATPSQSQVGFIKLKGSGIDIHFSIPGPLKLPNTFCAPWATNIVAIARRSGSGIQVPEVEVNLLNMRMWSFPETKKAVQILTGKAQGAKHKGRRAVWKHRRHCLFATAVCSHQAIWASFATIVCFGCAPMSRSINLPFLKSSMVGML